MKKYLLTITLSLCALSLVTATPALAASKKNKWKAVAGFATPLTPISIQPDRCVYRLSFKYTSAFLQAPIIHVFDQSGSSNLPTFGHQGLRFALDADQIIQPEGLRSALDAQALGRVLSYYSGGTKNAIGQHLNVDDIGQVSLQISYTTPNSASIVGESIINKGGFVLEQNCN